MIALVFRLVKLGRRLNGMGIGVFESREVVRALGGSLDVETEEGLGSCFRVVIPCAPTTIKTTAVA